MALRIRANGRTGRNVLGDGAKAGLLGICVAAFARMSVAQTSGRIVFCEWRPATGSHFDAPINVKQIAVAATAEVLSHSPEHRDDTPEEHDDFDAVLMLRSAVKNTEVLMRGIPGSNTVAYGFPELGIPTCILSRKVVCRAGERIRKR